MDTREQKNMTRALEALSPYLNSPRQTVIRIEAFVALAAALLFLQFILGGCRRRSGHWFIQGGLWLCYTLSFPLITYTIGLMVSSPIKNELYPLWAILLFWASGCTNSITVYALEENKQWKRYLFELFQYYVYSSVVFRLMNSSTSSYFSLEIVPSNQLDPVAIPLIALVVVLFVTNIFRVIAGWMVTNSTSSRVVADYMKATDLRGDEGILKGCRYLVRFYGIPGIGKGPTYRTRLTTHQMVTVNTICEVEQFGDDKNGGGLQWKDVCLSLALSELLKRRFYGMECAEANLPETRDFVLKGLLKQDLEPNNEDYARAFQIIEVELGFLYDFFFTKYAILAEFGMVIVLFMAALKLILISICGALVVRGSITIKTSKPVIEVGTTAVDVTITIVIIGTLFLVEVLQAILYVTSDWATVSLACSYTRSGTRYRKLIPFVILCLRRFNLSRTKFGKFFDRLNLFGYWRNEMGQSSIIEGCLHFRLDLIDHHDIFSIHLWLKQNLIDLWLSVKYPRKTFVAVPDPVKSEIVSALEEHCKRDGPLTNGKAALDRDANFGEFAWTLSKHHHSQTMVMLIWHIATEYCSIASPGEEAHRDVAIKLSRYCAYLMSFVPDLLPGNSTDTKFVNQAVLLEAKESLYGRKPSKSILEGVINQDSSNNNNEDTDNIFIKGLTLGTELEKKGAGRWKVLAEFWAETIIFIAPSDNATAHMERLAQGGEFLTHIWALLNHAGILTRDHAGAIP